ncbi:hypothetical protein LLEC1_00580 [Akanthomyces lecanii]|uniref:Major facilitator superfamily (MFS) profile domain-containing protein n=1 Tax=Cordyceps confragosa TaxID=2714763 RepID=A0A179IB18_CORDF|nr:hypothetical protein LLEC1_00580 [Akanthomyces lecanii]
MSSIDAEKAQPRAENDAPDGGRSAWLVVLGAWCCTFVSFGWVNSVGAFQEYYQNSLLKDYSASTIAWIPSLQIFFMNVMGPLIGIIYDRYGPHHLLLGGTLLHVFGLMMASLGSKYYQLLLAQGLCSAIGVSAVVQPAMSAIHGWFSKKRGTAFGILATGSSLGGVIFPIMVSRLIRQVGFPWTMRICAFLILALLVVANLTVKTFAPPRPQKRTINDYTQPLKEFDFLLLTLGFFCFTFGIYVPINYLEVQALQAGVSKALVPYLIPILNAASLFGRLFSGFAGDSIGRYNIFVIVCALTGIWVLALWIPSHNTGAITAFAALFGFSSGAYVSLIGPLVALVSPLSEIGFRTGIVFFVASIAGLVTNPICGAILGNDPDTSWTGVQVYSGVFCLVGTVLLAISRLKMTNWKVLAVL